LLPGSAPTEGSDRYALGLAFLRVVGAAHFPLQARQRTGEHVDVDLELPRAWRKLPGTVPLWHLCERSLSLVNACDRPHPSEWAGELEVLLDRLGSSGLAAAARTAQGDPRSLHPAAAASLAGRLSPAGQLGAGRHAPPSPDGDSGGPAVPDVTLWPVLRHRAPSTWQLISTRPLAPGPGAYGLTGIGLVAGLTARQFARRLLVAWGRAHVLAVSLLRSPGRRGHGLRRLAGVLLADVGAACVALFLVGMAVSPWIGL
jgi:hypothetical protein